MFDIHPLDPWETEIQVQNRYSYRRRVEFRDTDMAGIVHFSVFFAYMEESEHEFLRSIGLGVFSERDGVTISWPRVAASCNYRAAIRFEDEIEVQVALKRIGSTSLTYDHQILRQSELVADGSVTAVCCQLPPGERPLPMEIPREFLDRLAPYQLVADD